MESVVSKAWLKISALACIFFLVNVVCGAQENNTDETVQKLVDAGFVNVRAVEANGQIIYTIQNDAYKLQASGIAKALQIIDAENNSDGKVCKVIATYLGIPQVTLTYNPSAGSWKTTYRLDESWNAVKHEEMANVSYGKADIVVYPSLALKNLIINQVYQTLWQLNPAFEVSLWKGMKFTAQVKIPVHVKKFSGYDYESEVHPGMITLSQRFRLPGNVFMRATGGILGGYRYGIDLEAKYPLPNERFSLEGNITYSGEGQFRHGWDYVYKEFPDWTWSIGANYFWKPANTQFSLKVCQFLWSSAAVPQDRGVKFEMIRHFRGASIGFYAEKGFYKVEKPNGGFRFQVALPPYRNARWKSYPRVTTSGQMGMIYNANNEQRYYKEFKIEASDNIMEANGFNPIYIQSEINKLNY